jgi:transposase InsO family protein
LPEPRRRPSPPRALPAEERVTVLGYFYLYVILDVFSRHMAGWMVADREGKELAR